MFGNRGEADGYPLSKKIQLHWLTDGDHSFKLRKSSGKTQQDNWCQEVETVAEFVANLP